jgi:glycosyltransferase involved in cell wall biosynthesis
MQCSLPILAATDISSDVGKNAEEKGYGFWCESSSGNENEFIRLVNKLKNHEIRKQMGNKSRSVYEKEYDVEKVYSTIVKHVSGD